MVTDALWNAVRIKLIYVHRSFTSLQYSKHSFAIQMRSAPGSPQKFCT